MIRLTRQQARDLLSAFQGDDRSTINVEFKERGPCGPGLYAWAEGSEVGEHGYMLERVAPAEDYHACERCGCTDEDGCGVQVSDKVIVACTWVRPGLCTACATLPEIFRSSNGLAWLVTCLCECFGESLESIVHEAQSVAMAAELDAALAANPSLILPTGWDQRGEHRHG